MDAVKILFENLFNPNSYGEGGEPIWPPLSVTIKLQWKSWLHKIFWLFLKSSKGPKRYLWKFFSHFFYSSHIKFCHNMHWFFSKFILYLANKFCSISYNSNSIAIKTLCTPSWHQWHFSQNFFVNNACHWYQGGVHRVSIATEFELQLMLQNLLAKWDTNFEKIHCILTQNFVHQV